jgi:hypothetical protein
MGNLKISFKKYLHFKRVKYLSDFATIVGVKLKTYAF